MRVSKLVYCPYSDREIPEAEASLEHIIPLSLGGDDRLTIRVDRQVNSQVGHDIDGPLANDFLLSQRRAQYDARGHSGKEPEFVVKKAYDADSGAPLQAIFGNRRLRLRDPRTGLEVPLGGSITMSMRSNMLDLPTMFVAKVFLSAGYLVYGDHFRQAVEHRHARLILRGPNNLSPAELEGNQARIFAPLYGPENGQDEFFRIQEWICESILGSVVVLAPTSTSLRVFVGVLGMYLGMVNVPADTSCFPRTGDFALGHACILSNGNVLRWSFRRLLERLALSPDGRAR